MNEYVCCKNGLQQMVCRGNGSVVLFQFYDLSDFPGLTDEAVVKGGIRMQWLYEAFYYTESLGERIIGTLQGQDDLAPELCGNKDRI